MFPLSLLLRVAFSFLVLSIANSLYAQHSTGNSPRLERDLSGPGWSLWLDKEAKWQDDTLYLPGTDISSIPANLPTGGWEQLNAEKAKAVAVPGTVEEYFGPGRDPHDLLVGVSWWFRTVHIPEEAANRRVLLDFGAVRLRAEVYVDHQLVGYNLVDETPFSIDLTGKVKAGTDVQLAVRVTNPGGCLDWVDFHQINWGRYRLPAGHAFSGITDKVDLRVVEPIYISDVYMQNTPDPKKVNAIMTVVNTGDMAGKAALHLQVKAKDDQKQVFAGEQNGLELKPGENTVTIPVTAPDAKLWDLDSPNLYSATVTLLDGERAIDQATQIFGFRWFAPVDIGTNAMYRLNGKRLVLRTSISWGFWPITGLFPTQELATRQIKDAKAYGMNMLNFHRCIGKPIILNTADQLGLLQFEEPGGYVSGGPDPFGQALSREKLLRMVKRDRSHPSLVIYNMINEQYDEFHAKTDETLFSVHRQDQIKAHELDPSRMITYTSMVADTDKINFPEKDRMNMRPFDSTQYMIGEVDHHRADGPAEGVWMSDYYRNPMDHYGNIKNKEEIIYWGEEGASPSPPRLQLIKKEMASAPNLGWDGETYLEWEQAFEDYLTKQNFRSTFPTVDDLCVALGAPALEQQGRKIEDTRICDLNDGYAINGWESELFENHSGIVDCFRNPKSDPAILAYYNQPLYLPVKCRNQIVQIPGRSIVDFYIINEKNIQGPHTLKIEAINPLNQSVFKTEKQIIITGGDVYGQLIDEAVEIPIAEAQGNFAIKATLVDGNGRVVAEGRDWIVAVDWKTPAIPGKGAVMESGSLVRDLLKSGKGMDVPAFDVSMGHLDWILVAKGQQSDLVTIPAQAMKDPTGQPGLRATFYKGSNFETEVGSRTDTNIDYVWSGQAPDPSVGQDHDYSVRWEGTLQPPISGNYLFSTTSDDGARLWVNGKLVLDGWNVMDENQGSIDLEGGKPVSIKFEYHQGGGGASTVLRWGLPDGSMPAKVASLFDRARNEGTNLVFIDDLPSWMNQFEKNSTLKNAGTFELGGAGWVSGRYFVKAHPLFRDLPVNQALNWPYQSVLRQVRGHRYGFDLSGVETVAGVYNTYPMHLGTAVGIVPCGKGKIIFSTLAIKPALADSSGPAEVARKMLVNYLQYAAKNK